MVEYTSLVPKQITNRLTSDIRNRFCAIGTSLAPDAAVNGTPLGRILCVPDWVPDVVIAVPPAVADRLKVLDVRFLT